MQSIIDFIGDDYLDYDCFLYIDYGYNNLSLKEYTSLFSFSFGICRYMYQHKYGYSSDFKNNIKNIRPYLGFELGLEVEFNYWDFEFTKAYPIFATVIGCSKLITDRMSLESNAKFNISSKGIFKYGINFGIGYLFGIANQV